MTELFAGRIDFIFELIPFSQKHGKLIPIQCDVKARDDVLSVSSLEDYFLGYRCCCLLNGINQVVHKIEEDVGYIDCLINNAGTVSNLVDDIASVTDIDTLQERLWNAGTPEDFTQIFELNVKAVYYTTVAFLRLLNAGNRRRTSLGEPRSQVIIISSITGSPFWGFHSDGTTNSFSYNTSKTAATRMGTMFASLLAPWKIRCNVVEPGMYPSGGFALWE